MDSPRIGIGARGEWKEPGYGYRDQLTHNGESYLSAKAVSKLTGMSVPTISQHATSGKLRRYSPIPRRSSRDPWYFKEDEVREWAKTTQPKNMPKKGLG